VALYNGIIVFSALPELIAYLVVPSFKQSNYPLLAAKHLRLLLLHRTWNMEHGTWNMERSVGGRNIVTNVTTTTTTNNNKTFM